MTYEDRLAGYEREKRLLDRRCLDYDEYERELKKLIKKWGV